MINMKKLLTKILQALGSTVSKTGDTMTGDLQITRDGATSLVRVTSLDGDTTVADGQLSVSEFGSCGVYDLLHTKWVIRTDADGNQHIPLSMTVLNSTKVACTSIGTTYRYVSVPGMANWNVIFVHLVVHEVSDVYMCVRGESLERTATDAPSAGRFRGGMIVDWRNNRIGIRCVNAPTGRQNLVYLDYVYGVI